MKNKFTFLFSIFLLAFLSLLTGCSSHTFYIELSSEEQPHSPYKFKFYIEDIEVVLNGSSLMSSTSSDTCDYTAITFYCMEKAKEEAEERGLDINAKQRLVQEYKRRYKHAKEVVDTTRAAREFTANVRRELAEKYPDFFTNNRHEALPIKFQYNGAFKVYAESGWDTLLSFLTLGLLPATMEEHEIYYIRMQIEKIRETYCFSVKDDIRCNMGIIGLFLPTCFFIPIDRDYDKQSMGMRTENQILLRVTDKLLRAFCYSVMELDRDAIYRLYNRNYTPEVTF